MIGTIVGPHTPKNDDEKNCQQDIRPVGKYLTRTSMETKKIKWDDCKGVHISQDHTQNKSFQWNAPIKSGMNVSAKYSGLYVYLTVVEILPNNEFIATVCFFEPVSAPRPHDLSVGDSVLIDLKHICGIRNP